MSTPMRIADLGCGNKKRLGAVGIDFNDRTQADIVHDLNVFPYPVEAESFDEVYIDNCLEHLDHPLHVMEEVYRMTKPGALVKVIVPYFRSVWSAIDPTHQHTFTVESFAYYDPDHVICQRYDYTKARFKCERVVFNETLADRWTKRLVLKFANRWPARYEYYLSHLYPLDDITFYLRRL
jgi:ubiquinone/menaquinone biosynthesis C-methylase UbiE